MTSDDTMRDWRMLEAVIPYFEMEDGVLTKLKFMPIELGFAEPMWRRGNPHFSDRNGIVEYLSEISSAYGTKMFVDRRGYGVVEL